MHIEACACSLGSRRDPQSRSHPHAPLFGPAKWPSKGSRLLYAAHWAPKRPSSEVTDAVKIQGPSCTRAGAFPDNLFFVFYEDPRRPHSVVICQYSTLVIFSNPRDVTSHSTHFSPHTIHTRRLLWHFIKPLLLVRSCARDAIYAICTKVQNNNLKHYYCFGCK